MTKECAKYAKLKVTKKEDMCVQAMKKRVIKKNRVFS